MLIDSFLFMSNDSEWSPTPRSAQAPMLEAEPPWQSSMAQRTPGTTNDMHTTHTRVDAAQPPHQTNRRVSESDPHA